MIGIMRSCLPTWRPGEGRRKKNQAFVAMEEVENFPGSKKKPQIPHLPPYKTALATIPPGV